MQFTSFVNFKKTFDRIYCWKMTKILRIYAISENLINSINLSHKEIKFKVLTNDGEAETFETSPGAFQGNIPRSSLTNIITDHVTRKTVGKKTEKIDLF